MAAKVHYDGELVFSCHDEDGVIEVVDAATTRSLHFGTVARQTTMFLHDPQSLALTYTHCMMMGLLFLARPPRAALVLGLGGGALVRFLLARFPACRVEAVEKRRKIVEVAHQYFHLPTDPRLQVHALDAADFLLAEQGPYDLVLVDLHDSKGMAPVTRMPAFFSLCRRLLHPGGVLAVNLWSGQSETEMSHMMARLRRVFRQRVLYLPVAGKRNCVALGLDAALPRAPLSGLKLRAHVMGQSLGIDLDPLLLELVRVNPHKLLAG